MSAKGFYVAQEGHVVHLVPPVNVAGGKTSGVFNMANWRHATILLLLGVQSAALKTIQLESSDNGSPENVTPIPFNLHKCETAYNAANGDVLAAKSATAAAGFAPAATSNIMYAIEVDADTLPAGQNYVKLLLTDNSPAAASVLLAAVVVLSGGRFVHEASETVLT